MICDAAAVSLQMSLKEKDKPDKNEINNIVSLTLSISYCFGILTSADVFCFHGPIFFQRQRPKLQSLCNVHQNCIFFNI